MLPSYTPLRDFVSKTEDMNSEKWHSKLSSGHHVNVNICICESTLNIHRYTHTEIHTDIHIYTDTCRPYTHIHIPMQM